MKDCKYLKYNLKTKNTVRISLAAVFWVLWAFCMAVIFWFSSHSGDESQQLSDETLSLLIKLLGPILNSFIVRKFAHFFEFLALAFLLSGALFFTKKRFMPIAAFTGSVLYAVCDEIHQYFVPERACRIFDVFVDACGILCGILIFAGFLSLLNLLILKSKQKIGENCTFK